MVRPVFLAGASTLSGQVQPTFLRVRPGQQLQQQRALLIAAAAAAPCQRAHTRFPDNFRRGRRTSSKEAEIKLQGEQFCARTPSHTQLIFPSSIASAQ
jgi:hypothetical protein